MTNEEFIKLCKGKTRKEATAFMKESYNIDSNKFNVLYKKNNLLRKIPSQDEFSKIVLNSKSSKEAIRKFILDYNLSSSSFYEFKKRYNIS